MLRNRLALILGLAALLFVEGCNRETTTAPATTASLTASLSEARRSHPTRLLRRGPAPQQGESTAPPGLERITYHSDGRDLVAWLAIPEGQGPHPAILYAHSGYGLHPGDARLINPFLQAGYLVLLPSWRGENGNPGDFEMFYGEVDDAAAALAYLSNRPDVDRQNVFAVGLDTGATIVMLLAESLDQPHSLRGVVACGGFPDLRASVEETLQPIIDHIPFDWRDPIENDLRSPARHLKHLACPMALIFSQHENEMYIMQARGMQPTVKKLGKTVEVEVVPKTEHRTLFEGATPRILTYLGRWTRNAGPTEQGSTSAR